MDVSGRILRTWMPAIHVGMTKLSIFIFCKLMKDFVVLKSFVEWRVAGNVPPKKLVNLLCTLRFFPVRHREKPFFKCR
jgi:hypothetical protein